MYKLCDIKNVGLPTIISYAHNVLKMLLFLSFRLDFTGL